MKNYNKVSREDFRDNKQTFVDRSEDIKTKIKEQEEKIQEIKNSVDVYFINKCLFVNFREKPDIRSVVLDTIKNGTLIEPVIYNDTTDWTKVVYNNKTGYIMTKYIGVEISAPIE